LAVRKSDENALSSLMTNPIVQVLILPGVMALIGLYVTSRISPIETQLAVLSQQYLVTQSSIEKLTNQVEGRLATVEARALALETSSGVNRTRIDNLEKRPRQE
jgi:hypothetical protein